MTVSLRAHHLLCLLTYSGRGYTPAFTANLDAVCARLTAGEDAVLVEGPDDVCAPVLGPQHHCHEARISDRDAAALTEVIPLLDDPAAVTFTPELVGRLRREFASGAIRTACRGCQWDELCTATAASGFVDVRLVVEASGVITAL